MRRFKGIFGRQEDAAVINTTGKISVGSASNGAVVVWSVPKKRGARNRHVVLGEQCHVVTNEVLLHKQNEQVQQPNLQMPFMHIGFQRGGIVLIAGIQREFAHVGLNTTERRRLAHVSVVVCALKKQVSY